LIGTLNPKPRLFRKDKSLIKMLLVGPPGSGKGTQAKYIAEELGIVAISTGDIFRQNVQNRTPLGLEAQSYMNAGSFVPDAVTNGMVRDRLAQQDAQYGFLLDGYPRTPAQVNFLDELLADDGQELDTVLQLTVDTEELIQRLLKRAATEGRADDTCQWPIVCAHGRPAEMPAGGHENCPVMATRSAHQVFGGVGHARDLFNSCV
jgi:adenylate kinase